MAQRDTPDAPEAIGAAAMSEAALVERFRARLCLFAARRLGNASAAEDVAQETLRRVLEALRDGRVENLAALPGFVFRTALHICLQQHRSTGRESRALDRWGAGWDERDPATDPLAMLVTEERRSAVRRALEQLAPGDRELLRLVFFEQLDAEELAQRLAATPATLRVRKHRALQRLAQLLSGNESAGSGT